MNLDRIRAFLAPHKTIPITPWRAEHRWQLSAQRIAILWIGLAVFGLGDAFLVQGAIGNAPWTVFAQGIQKRFEIPLGWSTFLISLFVLLLWIPLRERPGFGTLSNVVLIASFIQIGVTYIPKQSSFFLGILFSLIGIALVGIGSSLYITCGLGSGPRDGAMTGLHRRTGVRVSRVRLGIELTVLVIGRLLGGKVGLGTLLFAALIGESIAISLGVVARLTSRPDSSH